MKTCEPASVHHPQISLIQRLMLPFYASSSDSVKANFQAHVSVPTHVSINDHKQSFTQTYDKEAREHSPRITVTDF